MDEKKKPQVECAKNGPYLVKDLEVLQGLLDGKSYETKAVTALCRCGQSGNKPYCDGTHKKVGFSDEKAADRTPDKRDDYMGQAITIHDNRGICAHAGLCTDGLASVFRLRQEPWIDPDGAEVRQIVETIEKCPSGALSYSIDGAERQEAGGDPAIMVAPNGPYAIKGGVELEGVAFGEGASRERFDLCRCGASKNKPFCNGAHWNTKFDEHAPEKGE